MTETVGQKETVEQVVNALDFLESRVEDVSVRLFPDGSFAIYQGCIDDEVLIEGKPGDSIEYAALREARNRKEPELDVPSGGVVTLESGRKATLFHTGLGFYVGLYKSGIASQFNEVPPFGGCWDKYGYGIALDESHPAPPDVKHRPEESEYAVAIP